MTNTHQFPEAFRPVMPFEVKAPSLSPEERNNFWLVCNAVSAGVPVFVSTLYVKQTDAAPRVEGEDYTGMPGVSCRAQFGPAMGVFRTKEGELRLRVWSIPRQGWTTIIPEGLERFVFFPPVEASLTRPQEG